MHSLQSKQLYLTHLRSPEHKDNSCVDILELDVPIIDGAFKNMIVTFRMNPSKNHNDFDDFFNDIIDKLFFL